MPERKGVGEEFVFGVDLDGCVADFYSRLKVLAGEWLGVDPATLTDEVSMDLKEWGFGEGEYERLHRWAITERNLFRDLEPIPGAAPALRRLSARGIRIRIITHRLYIPYFHAEAIYQTADWLDHHGIPYWDLCFMRDKGAVGADIYVEDNPENIAVLRASGAQVIAFAKHSQRGPGAARAANWVDVEGHVLLAATAMRAPGA